MNTRLLLGILSITILISGCFAGSKLYSPHRIDSQIEAGEVNFTITMVDHWDQFVEKLSPNFRLDSKGALGLVLKDTAAISSTSLDAAGVSANLATSGHIQTESKKTTLSDDGTSTRTGEKTSERTAPKPSDQALIIVGSSKDPTTKTGKSTELKELALRPHTQYPLADSLFKEVQILNQTVKSAALKRGYTPYIVRANVNVIPYARHQPYDVYSNISLFIDNKTGTYAGKQPYVLPILVSDDIESILASRSHEQIKQLGLQLALLNPGLGGDIGFSKLQDIFESVFARDLNSLFTVARVTDNTIRTRIGAAKESTSNYAMIARNYPVTFLLMIDQNATPADHSIRAVIKSSFRDAETGKLLAQAKRTDRTNAILKQIKTHVGEEIPTPLLKAAPVCDSRYPDVTQFSAQDMADDLLYLVLANNYQRFYKCVKLSEWDIPYMRDFWVDVTEALSVSQYSGSRADLPSFNNFNMPDEDQLVFLIDNPEKGLKAVLYNGSGLDNRQYTGHIKIKRKGGALETLPLTNIVGSGGSLTVTATSLNKWSIKDIERSDDKLADESVIEIRPVDGKWCKDDCANRTAQYKNLYYTTTKPEEKPVLYNANTASKSLLFGGGKDSGTFKLNVEFKKDKDKNNIAKKVAFIVKGAELVDAKVKEKSLVSKFNQFVVTENSVVDVTIRHPVKEDKVTISSSALDAKDKKLGKSKDDITITIRKGKQ